VSATVAVLLFAGALVAWYYESRQWENFEAHATQDESILFGGQPD
jgi:hypothetical protein